MSVINRLSQQGAVMVTTAIGMLAIVAVAGLALDTGHMLLNKSRLQNAVDAAALAGAKTLDLSGNSNQAQLDAETVFSANAADGTGNQELYNANLQPLIEFADNLSAGAFSTAPGADPQYIRVTVDSFSLASWLVQVIGINSKNVAASAVAGPSPTILNACNIAPMMVCGDSAPSATGYFGYEIGAVQMLKTSAGGGSEVGTGNFQLIRLSDSQGGSAIRTAMAGGYEGCINSGDVVQTEPGNTIGPVVQGFNTRFGKYVGPFSSQDEYSSSYKPDVIVTENTAPIVDSDGDGTIDTEASALGFNWGNYQAAVTSHSWDYDPAPVGQGHHERRIMAVPIGDCTGTVNGQGSVPLLGFGCFFMLQTVKQQGNNAAIYGQFVEKCQATGQPGPEPTNAAGPYKIQLYKDPENLDA